MQRRSGISGDGNGISTGMIKKVRAVFLDRDGTINEEVGYLSRLEELRLFPQSFEALRRLNECGFKVIVVTNQSGVARGFFGEEFVHTVHDRMNALLKEFEASRTEIVGQVRYQFEKDIILYLLHKLMDDPRSSVGDMIPKDKVDIVSLSKIVYFLTTSGIFNRLIELGLLE